MYIYGLVSLALYMCMFGTMRGMLHTLVDACVRPGQALLRAPVAAPRETASCAARPKPI